MTIPSTGSLVGIYELPGLTAVVTPDAPFDISWMDERNGTGTGTFTIPLDDAAYDDIDINHVATIRAGGRWFSFIIERIEERWLSPQEGGGRTATYSGRGAAAVLEWAPVTGSIDGNNHTPIEEDVVFDWRTVRYVPATYSDTWAAATEVDSVADAQGDNAGSGSWPQFPMAQRFDVTSDGSSEGAAEMIDISGSTTTAADPFWRLFYRDITFTVPGRYAIELGIDNSGFFWVDGVELYEVRDENGFVTAGFQHFDVSPGVHRFAWAGYNNETSPGSGVGQGPAAVFWNFYKADDQNLPLPGGMYLTSNSSTNVMYTGEDKDDWPGMTVGDILLQLLAESDDKWSTLGWLAPTFTVDEDSNGDPWPRVHVSTKNGTPILQFLDELVAAGHVSLWRVHPDAETFDVYAPGFESDPAVTLEPAPVADPLTGQLTELVVVRT